MKLLVAFGIGLLFQSCIYYPEMHYSVAQNVPLITQKGESQLSVSTGTEAIGFQAAYGLNNSVSIMGSYSTGIHDLIGDGDEFGVYEFNNGIRQSGELAIGYYYSISPHVLFEIYGGAERYYRSYYYAIWNQYTDTFSTNITKPFIQIDLGFLSAKKNGLGLSCKFGDLFFDHCADKVILSVGSGYTSPLDDNKTPIIEPCLTYRAGWKNISCQMQLGTTFIADPVGLVLSDIYVSIGIQARLYNLMKSSSKK